MQHPPSEAQQTAQLIAADVCATAIRLGVRFTVRPTRSAICIRLCPAGRRKAALLRELEGLAEETRAVSGSSDLVVTIAV